MKYELEKLKEKLIRGIVWHLPKAIVYWCAIRLMAHATMGKYGNTLPDSLNIMEALKRWDVKC